MNATVTALHTALIKGTRIISVDEVALDERGAAGDRRFFIADARDRLRNSTQVGKLQAVVASLVDGDVLRLEFPDGSVVQDRISYDGEATVKFYAHRVRGRVVAGPWAQALSEFCGEPLRLMEAGSAVDRGAQGAVSLVSRGSLRRLAEQAQTDAVDSRRFRMLIEVDGVEPHAEDGWLGQELRVGDAVLRFDGHVGRCKVTTRDPETGKVTLPTLQLLRAYRNDEETTEPIAFGVYGRVLRPGTVRVGDTLEPVA